jgi:transposase-like protein
VNTNKRVNENSDRGFRAGPELMAQMVADFRLSGKSKSAFARELGVAWGTLDRWCRLEQQRLGPQQNAKGAGQLTLLEVAPARVEAAREHPATGSQIGEQAWAEIVAPTGWRLRLSPGVEASRVRELLEALAPC